MSRPLASPRPSRLAGPLAALLCLWLSAGVARAHDENVSSSDVLVEGARVIWKVDVGVLGLGKAIRLPAPEPTFDEEHLAAAEPEIVRFVASGLELVADGRPLRLGDALVEPAYEPHVATGRPYLARVVVALRYEAPRPIDTLEAKVRFFATLTASHRAVVKITWERERKQLVRLGPTELRLERGRLHPTAWQVAWDFLRWGAHHIFVGYDHIAFLLALLLAVRRLRELVLIVTAFTVAHSVTILLAALEIVRVPGRVTEILIAASIVYVAVENLIRGDAPVRRRALVTFAFGLVHGLGFATELRARIAELGGNVVFPVLSFNLGVELGQLAIVALVFPLLQAARRREGDARRAGLTRLGSVPILLAGLYWLVTRIAG